MKRNSFAILIGIGTAISIFSAVLVADILMLGVLFSPAVISQLVLAIYAIALIILIRKNKFIPWLVFLFLLLHLLIALFQLIFLSFIIYVIIEFIYYVFTMIMYFKLEKER